MSTDALIVATTTGNQDDAEKIAQALIEKRLAACVQISGPITSHYRWQGALETSQEWMCTIKTLKQHYSLVEQAIHELHPYDEPEILATPVVAGSAGYLRWLAEEASGAG